MSNCCSSKAGELLQPLADAPTAYTPCPAHPVLRRTRAKPAWLLRQTPAKVVWKLHVPSKCQRAGSDSKHPWATFIPKTIIYINQHLPEAWFNSSCTLHHGGNSCHFHHTPGLALINLTGAMSQAKGHWSIASEEVLPCGQEVTRGPTRPPLDIWVIPPPKKSWSHQSGSRCSSCRSSVRRKVFPTIRPWRAGMASIRKRL